MYTDSDLIEMSGKQLSSKYYHRSVNAFNELSKMFGKDWVDTEVVLQYVYDPVIIKALGTDRIYRGINSVERLVFLWEDIELIKNFPNFENLSNKLRGGVRSENIDLEISIAADIVRCGGQLELNPHVGIKGNISDCKFTIPENAENVYVEITRRGSTKIKEKINTQGDEIARLVSLVNPSRRYVFLMKKEIDDSEYLEIKDWLTSFPDEGVFKDLGVFFFS
jgi:hypothetical protein